MKDFFYGEPGLPISFFGVTHILLILGFIILTILLWYVSPKIKNSKYEMWFRLALIVLVFLFEWKVFESRLLNTSVFRLPLCAIAIYMLTYSVAFKNEKVFKIAYFFAFGSILSYIFFDTPWGLNRWAAWQFFGAHATIAWLAVYGYKVLNFKPTIKDFYISVIALTIYAFIAGYGTYKYGGSDEMFLLTPPIEELNALVDIHQALYTILFSIVGILFMYVMYLFTKISFRKTG